MISGNSLAIFVIDSNRLFHGAFFDKAGDRIGVDAVADNGCDFLTHYAEVSPEVSRIAGETCGPDTFFGSVQLDTSRNALDVEGGNVAIINLATVIQNFLL